VLELLAQGLSPKEIALQLVVSPKTVASHVQRLLAKLGVHSRPEPVAVAYRDGLVPVPLPAERTDDLEAHSSSSPKMRREAIVIPFEPIAAKSRPARSCADGHTVAQPVTHDRASPHPCGRAR
jgi:Bacterial regulatory proteins, luxR family